jgi:hypothetical protein
MISMLTRLCFVLASFFPHGITSVYALILSFSASLLALSSSWGCHFIHVDFVFQYNTPDEIDDLGGMTMGRLQYQDLSPGSSGQCTSYSVEQMEQFDGYFRAARAFALLANIVLGVSALMLMIMSCTAMRSSVVTCISALLLIGSVFQGLTMLVYFSSFACESCQFYIGSALALLGTVVSFVAGALVCHIPNAVFLDDDEQDSLEGKFQSQRIARPPTPRNNTFLRHISNLSINSTHSSIDEEEFYIPQTLAVYDTEVVLVLPDGSKQVITPHALPACNIGCSLFPTEAG